LNPNYPIAHPNREVMRGPIPKAEHQIPESGKFFDEPPVMLSDEAIQYQ